MPGMLKNLVGKKFGKLTVISLFTICKKRKMALWECSCECGGKKICYTNPLKTGKNKSCGNCNSRVKSLSGQRFGLLVAKSFVIETKHIKNKKRSRAVWECVCDCGAIVFIDAADLKKKPDKTGNCGNKKIHNRSRDSAKKFNEKIVSEWSDISGTPPYLIRQRIRMGWSIEDSVWIKSRMSEEE